MDRMQCSLGRERREVWGSAEEYNDNQKPLATCTLQFLQIYAPLHLYFQLKKEFKIVKDIRNQPGWGWSHERHIVRVSFGRWRDYVAVSDAAPSSSIKTQHSFITEKSKSKAIFQKRISIIRKDCGARRWCAYSGK